MILIRPVPASFPVTQLFGENPQLYPSTHGHMGIDYGVPVGTNVRAAAGGEDDAAADSGAAGDCAGLGCEGAEGDGWGVVVMP